MKRYDAIDKSLPGSGLAPRPKRPRSVKVAMITAVTLLVVWSALKGLAPDLVESVLGGLMGEKEDYVAQYKSFDFFAVGAKETFEFSPCFEDFQCAKLKLPLDYFNGTYANESVSLAIIKLPAKVPIDDPRYGGPVLLNPGGPGGSGVALALLQGKQIQIIIDPASGSNGESKYYDIIGFDPRGIGYTEPPARCMPDMASSWSWRLRVGTEGMLGSSNAALGRLWSMTHAFGTSCKEASDANDGPDIKKYISTASVARDMLEIAEKHADWVAEKTAGLSVSRDVSDKKTVKLQYWGFSYGTYLGATFAALFPDRVGRVVLDGVVNVHDYNNALGQGSLHDTERNMHSFYTFCKGAGGELCPLALSSSSTENIEQRVKKIIGSLYHNPITITTAEHGPDIFTYTDLMAIIFSALYTPTYAFTFVAKILSDVENRGGPTLDSLTRNFIPTHVYQCPIGNSSLHIPWDTNVPGTSILCGDGIDQSPTTLEAFEEYWHLLNGISPSAGSLWAMLKMQCTAWKIRPLFRFGDDENFYGNTSYPILWISTTADPVTPLRSARIMQERFPGSGLLVQDSAGHCSISTPTPCSILRIREYFQRGALPDENTVCIPPPSPWSLNSTDSSSPFYDPSLGQPVYLTEEGYEEEMTAARDLQLWAIDHDFLGRHLAGPRVKSMMTSISAKDWVMVNGIDEIVI